MDTELLKLVLSTKINPKLGRFWWKWRTETIWASYTRYMYNGLIAIQTIVFSAEKAIFIEQVPMLTLIVFPGEEAASY